MPDRSRSFRTRAVVLRRVEYGEADLILTLLTPNYGKLSAIAKSARKPGTKSSGHVELYSLIDILLGHGSNLHIVTQVELINPYLSLGNDLERMTYASHFVELIDRFSVDDQENRQAFELLTQALGWLCEPDTDLRLTARYFELRLLIVMGYGPSLFNCIVSGEPLDAVDHFYSVSDGGVVHHDHAESMPGLIPLPLGAFKVLRHFSRYRWEKAKGLDLQPSTYIVLERVLHGTIAYLLERNLQSIAFLRRIANTSRPLADPE